MTEARRWAPLSRRGEPRAEALHDGVPPWLAQSLWEWVRGHIEFRDELGQRHIDNKGLLRLERRLQMRLNWRGGPIGALMDLEASAGASESLLLDLVDAQLDDLSADSDGVAVANHLERVLVEGGSAWGVALRGERLGLERRVDETVTAAAQATMGAPGAAGEHLTRAWAEVYGRSPDPTAAYAAAVKAVESAAQPVVTPEDSKATLGKMIAALGDKPAKWGTVLPGGAGLVRQMAEGLWKGQTDRHGGSDPTPVTQDGAEAAVHLAVLLVQWFSAGAIRRGD